MSKKAIELLRVSTSDQAGADRAGIPAQRAANRQTAKQYGLEIVRTIEISDVSGAAVLHASEMQELLRLIESPDIDGVIAKEFSRLMRPDNYADYALLQAFVDTKTALYLPEGPIDLASKSGRLLGIIRAAIAGMERTEILERVWGAKEEKRRAGKHPQSDITLPFGVGYDRKQECWFYKPDSAKVSEAFRLFLSGQTSYYELGRRVGIPASALRLILRNPIYTGWRIYDQKRDSSCGGRRLKANGRQGDRRKIARGPDEVIRVKVLDPPLVSESEFRRVQQIMDLKRQYHWRCRPGYQHRFVFRGFLRCAECGNLIYTHTRPKRRPHAKREDWYVCKSRTTAARRAREQKGLDACHNPYMQRERLETTINKLFGQLLTDDAFLTCVAAEYKARCSSNDTQVQALKIQEKLQKIRRKRDRVLNTYFDGHIDEAERDQFLHEIDKEAETYEDLLLQSKPTEDNLTAEALANLFSPFFEWDFLSTEDKRNLLECTTPEIHVQDYEVKGISVFANPVSRDEITHTGRDSSPPPA